MAHDEYHAAAICDLGHVVSTTVRAAGPGVRVLVSTDREWKPPPHCPHCGAVVHTTCPACRASIASRPVGEEFVRPQFCERCGQAFPWLDRDGLFDLLKRRLREEAPLESAERLKLEAELDALRVLDPEDKAAAARWKRVKTTVGLAWHSPAVQQVLARLLTGGLQKIG